LAQPRRASGYEDAPASGPTYRPARGSASRINLRRVKATRLSLPPTKSHQRSEKHYVTPGLAIYVQERGDL
jgi:hypothetical protein